MPIQTNTIVRKQYQLALLYHLLIDIINIISLINIQQIVYLFIVIFQVLILFIFWPIHLTISTLVHHFLTNLHLQLHRRLTSYFVYQQYAILATNHRFLYLRFYKFIKLVLFTVHFLLFNYTLLVLFIFAFLFAVPLFLKLSK